MVVQLRTDARKSAVAEKSLRAAVLLLAFSLPALPAAGEPADAAAAAAGLRGVQVAQAGDVRAGGGSPAETGIEEIIVRTRKRDESLQDVPVAVTAFPAETIERLAPSTLRDFDGLAPNVFIGMNTAGPSASAIYIRGQGYADIEKTQHPTTGVLLDNVFLGTSTGQLLDAFDIEQVEINRGPQTVLQGKNTSGGTIVVRRRNPNLQSLGARLLGSRGEFDGRGSGDAWNLQGSVNVPLVQNVLGLRGGFTHKRGDGYWLNEVTGSSRGAVDYTAGNLKLLFKPNEAFSVLLNWDRLEDRGHIPPQDPTFDGDDPFVNRADRRNPEEGQIYDVDSLSAEATLKTEIGDFTAIASYLRGHDVVFQDFDGTRCGPDGSYAGCVGAGATNDLDTNTPFAQLHTDRDQYWRQGSLELRWTDSYLDNRLNVTGGLFWWHDNLSLVQRSEQVAQISFGIPAGLGFNCRTNLPSPLIPANTFFDGATRTVPVSPTNPNGQELLCLSPSVPSTQRSGQVTDSFAVFAQVSYDITDDLSATVGARYIDEEKEFQHRYFNTASGLPIARIPEAAVTLLLDQTRAAAVAAGTPAAVIAGALAAVEAQYRFPLVQDRDSWDDVVLSASLDYHLPQVALDVLAADSVLAYLSFAQGFRSGGYSIRYAGDFPAAALTALGTLAALPPAAMQTPEQMAAGAAAQATLAAASTTVDRSRLTYEPENTTTYEVGLKTAWLGGQLTANLAGFITQIDNQQANSILVTPGISPGTTTLILNHDESQIVGAELEARWTATDFLTLYGSVGWQDGEVEKSLQESRDLPLGTNGEAGPGPMPGLDGMLGTDDDIIPTTELGKGGLANKLARTPELSGVLGVTLRIPTRSGEITTDLRWKYQDEFFVSTSTVGSPVLQEAYELLDATLAYELPMQNEGSMRLALVGRNLLNEEYLEQALPVAGFQGWGPPRYVGLEVGLNF